MIRVLLAEDHGIVREGIKSLLEYDKDIVVVGEAEDGVSMISKYDEVRPDVVVADISMPNKSGPEATHIILSKYPEAPILTRIAGGVPSTITLEKISAPGIIIVGDAARQVNPLSGGGIVSGMIGGKIGGTIVGEAIKKNNLNHILSYDKAWRDRLGKRHEIFDRIKNVFYNLSDEKFNSIVHSFSKIPMDKRSLGTWFKTALINKPSILIDIAKVFIFK